MVRTSWKCIQKDFLWIAILQHVSRDAWSQTGLAEVIALNIKITISYQITLPHVLPKVCELISEVDKYIFLHYYSRFFPVTVCILCRNNKATVIYYWFKTMRANNMTWTDLHASVTGSPTFHAFVLLHRVALYLQGTFSSQDSPPSPSSRTLCGRRISPNSPNGPSSLLLQTGAEVTPVYPVLSLALVVTATRTCASQYSHTWQARAFQAAQTASE